MEVATGCPVAVIFNYGGPGRSWQGATLHVHPGPEARLAGLGGTSCLRSSLVGFGLDLRDISWCSCSMLPYGENQSCFCWGENCLLELWKLLSLGKRVGCTQQFCFEVYLLGKSTNSFVICPAASQPPSPCASSFAYFNSNSLNSVDKSWLCWVKEY